MTQIPAGWEETTLGERAEAMFSWGTPSTSREEYYSWEIPWVRTQEVNFNYINKTEVNITELGLKNSSAKWIKKNTVIIAMYWNSAWRVAYSNIDATTNQACCNFFGNKSCDNKFVFFNLMNRYKEILWMANWAAQQNLSVTVLKQLPIHLPPLPEQQAIAAVLSSFDDKIELLRAENQTLEQMGQELFKERFGKWKVGDELPEGWRVGKLGVEITPKQGKYIDAKYISDNQNDIHKYPIYWGSWIRGYVRTFDYSNPMTILTCRWNWCGLIQFTERYSTITNSCMVFDSETVWLSSERIYLRSKNINFESVISGSAQPQITISSLFNMSIVVPDQEILSKFNLVIKPLFNKIRANSKQIQTLSVTRDQLLPKLMSWEVRVKF